MLMSQRDIQFSKLLEMFLKSPQSALWLKIYDHKELYDHGSDG